MLAVFSSTVLAMLGSLFIIKERSGSHSMRPTVRPSTGGTPRAPAYEYCTRDNGGGGCIPAERVCVQWDLLCQKIWVALFACCKISILRAMVTQVLSQTNDL